MNPMPAWKPIRPRPFPTNRVSIGRMPPAGPALLMLSVPFALWIGSTPAAVFPAWTVAAPSMPALPLLTILVLALVLLIWRRAGERFNRACKFASVAVLALGAAAAVRACLAYGSATPGAYVRAQIVGTGSTIGYHHRRRTVTFATSDGRSFTDEVQWRSPGSKDRCFDGRIWTSGPYTWLALGRGSPLPKSGQLTWPIDRKECFGLTKLEELGGH